ncbi:hypothetical protein TNCV_4111571 [Trichonephila clavipes]|nr:hypothetical protein TNCV_4111571 [Trichonephila clavipes]
MDDLRVVYVKVKGEQEMANAVMDTGAQMPVVRPDVVEGQSIDNRGSVQVTSAFGEHEMGEVKDSNMELNDLRHGVVPVSKNLVNDMLICSSDFEGLREKWQMVRNPAILREPSGEEGIINLVNSKSVCSQEVVTDLLPETQSLLNVPNGDLVAVKINGSNVQTNGQGIKESKGEVALTCGFKKGILYSTRRGYPRQESTLAIPYAVLFQLQACSPPDELSVVGNNHPGKQRNFQWLQQLGSNHVAPNLDVQQPIFFGPHGGVGSTECRPLAYVHRALPHEADYVLFGWTPFVLLPRATVFAAS